jgi:uncharacterized membrane protein YjdF
MATSLVVWAATEAAIRLPSRKPPAPIPPFIPLLPVAAVYLDALGDFLHWYAVFGWYDQLTHFAGGAATAGLLSIFFTSWVRQHGYPASKRVLALITIATTALAGSLYEIEEYLEDYFRGTAMRLGDGPDTASDLLFNLLGALAAVTLAAIYSRTSKDLPHRFRS